MANLTGRRCVLIVGANSNLQADAEAQLRILRAYASQHKMSVVDEIRERTLALNCWLQAALTQRVERGCAKLLDLIRI